MGFSLRLSRRFRAHTLGRRDRHGLAKAGSAAVEFAVIAPVLLMLLMGVFTYGGYFLTAQSVQQLANDAARAAIAGLDDEERRAIAEAAMQSGIAANRHMKGALSQIQVERRGDNLVVAVTYDAREDVYWAFKTLAPVPSPMISRRATIRVGGFL